MSTPRVHRAGNEWPTSAHVTPTTQPLAGGGAAKSVLQSTGGRLILRGDFAVALDARDPSLNRLAKPAQQVLLNAKTGEVVSG